MKTLLQAMALLVLLRRWRSLDYRGLWLLLVTLTALYLLLLSLLTQPLHEVLNVVLVLGGALLVLNGPPAGWQPRPGRLGKWAGIALLVAVFWRGHRMMSSEFISSFLPPLAGMGLALLAAPVSKLRPFLPSLSVLALLPVMRTVEWLTPLHPLALATAWLSQQMLTLCGYTAVRYGTSVYLPGGGVVVSELCAGLSILLQLLVVAVIFAMAYPMRHRWQNGLMIVVAPLIAMIVNGMRITLLALILASNLPSKNWWFEFFHTHGGSLVSGGIAIQLFVWLYVYWMARQLAWLGGR